HSVASLSGGAHTVIDGNVFDGGGVQIEGVDLTGQQGGLIIADNSILEPFDRHGIALIDCDRANVHHNAIVVLNMNTDDTYDGINLDADCSGCLVDHNQIITDNGELRYGINGPA